MVIGVPVLMVPLLRECMRCQPRGRESPAGQRIRVGTWQRPPQACRQEKHSHVSRTVCKEFQTVGVWIV